jgi:hypothetical protein
VMDGSAASVRHVRAPLGGGSQVTPGGGLRGSELSRVRIGVYVDGFNLYYGARGLCGRGTPGWRWLDLRGVPTAGAGGHWWTRLTCGDLKSHQLPDPAGRYRRPAGW